MKRFAIRVVLHILLIVLLSIGSYLLFQKQLWFSTTSNPQLNFQQLSNNFLPCMRVLCLSFVLL